MLSSAGIFAVIFYAVGWLYWRAYFGYFHVPVGAVDLGIVDIALGGFPQFVPVITVLASMPIAVLLERGLFRSTRGLLTIQADFETLTELHQDLQRRRDKALQEPDYEAAEQILREYEALDKLLTEFESAPSYKVLTWLRRFRSWPLRWALPTLVGVVFLVGLGLQFLISYLMDGLPSAYARLPGAALGLILISAAFTLAYQVWERRLNWRSVLFAVIILVGIPASAWLDGRLSAYAEWHSDNRDDYFQLVVLYSELPVFDEWEQQGGGLYTSPELMLIRKAGGTYVVANEDEPDKITIIASDIITHVDYMR